ncbi:YgjV family protein [Methylomonas sp. UP202]|uniref:YgjV family protein n=1 Tax=Methylomonas sp. UP202 TaxID=3040943 RepID=UPI0024788941|nr:YgjV family protein [Methylomonas sp. UP202]WGS85414.1 YgjV family protein [Methylomonas sp. UP202]
MTELAGLLADIPIQHGWAYLAGGVGVIVEWRAYLTQNGLRFRRWSAAGALLWALQYVLLAAWTAALTMACTALRTALSAKWDQAPHKHWAAIGFVALFIGLTAMSWQGEVSLLPAFAVVNTTLALFYLDNRRMRIGLLASSLAWIGNDWYWQAWPALIAESVAMLINLRTLSRLPAHR